MKRTMRELVEEELLIMSELKYGDYRLVTTYIEQGLSNLEDIQLLHLLRKAYSYRETC